MKLEHKLVTGLFVVLAASPALAADRVDPRVRLLSSPRGESLRRTALGIAHDVPVTIELDHRPTARDRARLESAGSKLSRDFALDGDNTIAADVPMSRVDDVAKVDGVVRVELDGSIVKTPSPLELTAGLVKADATWRSHVEGGSNLTGSGITICDVDAGVDPFHPAMFRADGGYFGWKDENGNGKLDPGTDTVDFGNGPVVLRLLDGVVIDRKSGTVSDGQGGDWDSRYDYLYADENGDGARNYGPSAGFTEQTPSYGERLFVVDDVDQDGVIDVHEKIVALATSKLKLYHIDTKDYRRGENLIDAPWDDAMLHGVGATAVLAAGQPGLSKLIGMAPDADVIVASDTQGNRRLQMTKLCIAEGARVVLHEYAPWVGYFLDGSSSLEKLIDDTQARGVVHVNPAGNLSTSKKLYKNEVVAGSTTVIPLTAPELGESVMGLTFLWRDVDRALSFTLKMPDGAELVLPLENPNGFTQEITPGITVGGYRQDSSRGTAKVELYVYATSGPPAKLTTGDYSITITDPSPPDAAPFTIFGYVYDEVSGWGQGIVFNDHTSEDHLIGWPGTADHGMAIAAYVGHPEHDDETGEREYYSGRGRRIDDEPLLWISAPANPIVPGHFADYPLAYMNYGGTSGASPHVAGGAALMLQAHPELTGDEVKAKIASSADVDAQTGEVPNEDFGYGKLNIYRAIFGTDPVGGAAPKIDDQEIGVEVGHSDVGLVATDPDGDPLVLEVDREYDGVYDETLSEDNLSLDFGKADIGEHWLKVRATDPSGRTDAALVRVTVTEAQKQPDPPTDLVDEDTTTGGCDCSVDKGPTGNGLGLVGAAVAVWALRRRRR